MRHSFPTSRGSWRASRRSGPERDLSHRVHLTSPGTPDIYQGDELWNFTLVDPDNRRPVDYEARSARFAELADIDERFTTAVRSTSSRRGSSC